MAATRSSRRVRCTSIDKDGVAVANEIALEERHVNIGAQILREAARKAWWTAIIYDARTWNAIRRSS